MLMTRKLFAAALALALTAPASAVAARADHYDDSLKCVSLYIIAGQALAQDSMGAQQVDRQADSASRFFDFARAQRPSYEKAKVDADLAAQMDKDYALITTPGADYGAFLKGRKTLCDKLKLKI